ncbi:MAG: hypothetical protein P4L81_02505, partial [Candidatus Pacebacteria bacterium]|nr:hypothetical protein [Candidatus Paceibacterota bacterium]
MLQQNLDVKEFSVKDGPPATSSTKNCPSMKIILRSMKIFCGHFKFISSATKNHFLKQEFQKEPIF